MPNLPRLPKKKRQYKRQPTGKQKSVYQRNTWRKFSYRYKLNNPLCEACLMDGEVTDVSPGQGNGVADHIIQLSRWKAAVYDERNIMTLCNKHHAIKSNYEGQNRFSFLVGEKNDSGYLVPTDEEKDRVLKIITKRDDDL